MDRQTIFEIILLFSNSLLTVLLAEQGVSVRSNQRKIGHANESLGNLHSCLDITKEEIRQVQRSLDELKESLAKS